MFPPSSFTPQVDLQWKTRADMPEGVAWAQAVVMGEKVYIGGGNTQNLDDMRQVFQYDSSQDKWSRLPPCDAIMFAIAQFMGSLITVGGVVEDGVNAKVYRFVEETQKWDEFLKPMPTARFSPAVATTQSAIVVSGGGTGDIDGNTLPTTAVEVYSSETSQWHTADPLPIPYTSMTSVTITDTWYQLGGIGIDDAILTVLSAPLTDLIQKATSPTHQSASPKTVWKTLPDTPLKESAAASVNGNLLAVGGYNSPSPAVYVFLPDTNSWVRVTNGDLPEPRYACAAAQLSSNQVLAVGGQAENNNLNLKTVFLGSASS